MNLGRLLGGILLVAGTAIGAGMLALPVSTGLAGFYPSLFLFLQKPRQKISICLEITLKCVKIFVSL